MTARIDLTNQRFDRLVVNRYAYNKLGHAYWYCTCDCGNKVIICGNNLRNGTTHSCGCFQRERSSIANMNNIVGHRFGRLVVIAPQKERKNHDMLWICKCDCGNTTIVSTTCLKNGSTKSCGCYRKEVTSINSRKDLSGKRFGKLIAIKDVGISRNQVLWDCLCDCGNHKITRAVDLLRGHTTSCGCIKSSVEYIISCFLNDNNVNYIPQKSFIGCKDINILPFDFYLPDYNMAIEYDGEFHYKETSLSNDLKGQQRRDAIKTQYCEENDIILLRIPYWEKDNIESILKDWLFLYNDEEAGCAA